MGLVELYHYINTEIADKRTNHWFLVSSPVPIILISLAYLYFVLKCGPRYMKDKSPYKLYNFIRLYNVFQIVTNAWFVYEAIDAGWYRDYFFYCRPVDYSSSPQGVKFTYLAWYLLLLKLIDYIETCIFVLRKKDRQISFLHLYHHISTVVVAWVFLKYYCLGMVLTVPLVNSTVHVIMYTYYLLSSFGQFVQQLLNPIKKMITIIQMMQFVVLIAYGLHASIPGCPGTEAARFKIGATIAITNLFINFALFYNFYRQNYVKKNKQK